MEADLGMQLFERYNRKVELTQAGDYLKNELTRNLRQLDDIINHAKLLHDGKRTIKVGLCGVCYTENNS